MVGHNDGERLAVALFVLIAESHLAVAVGVATGNGNGELAALIRRTGAVVVVLVGNGRNHALYGRLVLCQQDGNSSLIGIVQNTAVGQANGDAAALVQRHLGVGNGIFGVGIGDDYQIAAHDGLTLGIDSSGQI